MGFQRPFALCFLSLAASSVKGLPLAEGRAAAPLAPIAPETELPDRNCTVTVTLLRLSERVWEADVVYRWKNPRSGSSGEAVQRYRDNGELRFSLRSFGQMQGARFFHIIAQGPPPSWLNLSHPRIFWWNETTLLNDLRQERKIVKPLAVANSEPSKLVVARVPNLAPRFILTDDDYFLFPRHGSSTRLFFDESGVPIQTSKIMMSHRPIPFLRDAYRQAVRHEGDQTVTNLLTSGTAFNGSDLRPEVDPLPRLCERMQQEGTAICHYMPKLFGECAHSSVCKAETSLDPGTKKRSEFTHYWLKRWEPVESQYITANESSSFFEILEEEMPLTFCELPCARILCIYPVSPFRACSICPPWRVG
jgi:hypothetical protein